MNKISNILAGASLSLVTLSTGAQVSIQEATQQNVDICLNPTTIVQRANCDLSAHKRNSLGPGSDDRRMIESKRDLVNAYVRSLTKGSEVVHFSDNKETSTIEPNFRIPGTNMDFKVRYNGSSFRFIAEMRY